MTKCPLCDSAAMSVIYFGLPHKLCEDDRCGCLFGWAERLTRRLPFNGFFLAYDGSYIAALWAWLKGDVHA